MQYTNLNYSFVSEIHNFDVQNASDEQLKEVKALLYKRKVIALKNQVIDRDTFLAFVKRFGNVERFQFKNYHDPKYPEILVINNLNRGQGIGARKLGNMWHSDSSFLSNPPALSFLHAQRIQQGTGNTLFVDMEKALSELPQKLQAAIKNRKAEHNIRWTYKIQQSDIGESIKAIIDRLKNNSPSVFHPTIIIHPITKQPALYLNPGYCIALSDYSNEESQNLLNAIFEHVLQPQNIFEYQWSPSDLIIWDNRSVMHSATDISDDVDRLMHRISVRDLGSFNEEDLCAPSFKTSEENLSKVSA